MTMPLGDAITTFVIPGRPVGKQRPAGSSHRYIPAKTSDWERQVGHLAKMNMTTSTITPQAIGVSIDIRLSPPKAWKKSERMNALAGNVAPCATPDIDNVLKSILDGLSKIAFVDDRQVSMIVMTRRYALRNETEVGVFPIVQRSP